MVKYIYQYDNWPNFTWEENEIQSLLGEVRHLWLFRSNGASLFGQTVPL